MCYVCSSLCGGVYGCVSVPCVCVRVSMCVLFVACCAVLYGLPLVLVVLCSCVLFKMCVRSVCDVFVSCCICVFDGLCVCVCLFRNETVVRL